MNTKAILQRKKKSGGHNVVSRLTAKLHCQDATAPLPRESQRWTEKGPETATRMGLAGFQQLEEGQPLINSAGNRRLEAKTYEEPIHPLTPYTKTYSKCITDPNADLRLKNL